MTFHQAAIIQEEEFEAFKQKAITAGQGEKNPL